MTGNSGQANGNATANGHAPIRSILDTDLYKLTMQQAVLHHYPDCKVAYKFTNRSKQMSFSANTVASIQRYIDDLALLSLSQQERAWLEANCPYLRPEYLDFLAQFRFDPSNQVKIELVNARDLSIVIEGFWREVILYEVPLMAIVSQAYFELEDKDWDLKGQRTLASEKAQAMVSSGIRFSEFGTRRRRSYATHKAVIEGLLQGEERALAASPTNPGKLLGTSNVHFAQMFDLVPIGTVAHEWTMALAALEGYSHSNLTALEKWDQVYSPPEFVPNSPTHDLTIALTDTFSTAVFWNDLLSSEKGKEIARRWRGLRQDSGDSKAFARRAKEAYESIGVDPKTKVVIYSDSLDVNRCIDLAKYSKELGIAAGFGVGTNLTNDFCKLAGGETSQDLDAKPRSGTEKSKPLNIVIKLDKVDGQPVVKISDDLTKNTGDPDEVRMVKRRFGLDGLEQVEDA